MSSSLEPSDRQERYKRRNKQKNAQRKAEEIQKAELVPIRRSKRKLVAVKGAPKKKKQDRKTKEKKGHRSDDVNSDMIDLWPAAMTRYDYPVLARSCFECLKFLAQGGLGVVFSARIKSRHAQLFVKDKGRRLESMDVVLKSVLDPRDWNVEISGYHHNRDNPHVVTILALVLLSARECNQLCEGRKGYVRRDEGTLVPTMIFEKWDGSLDDAIDDGLVRRWGLLQAMDVVIGVAKAMVILHKSGNMHRDINPANIFYRVNENGLAGVALGDLGLCTFSGSETRARSSRVERTTGCGTDGFIAPECKTGNYSHLADVFSLAITVEQTIKAALPKNKPIHPILEELVERGKTGNPDERLTGEQMLEQLQVIQISLVEEEERKNGRRRSGLRARRKEKKKDSNFAYAGFDER